MDASPRSSSNNVTVEYTDPSGLFPLVKPLLSETLPLRNLHWKSPTRPLRSIDSLHIDFVPAQGTADEEKRLSDGQGGPVSQRRHQIPGLRRTPYLKIYLLRCDDNESYKATSRKLLREWVKTRGSLSQSSSSSASAPDNHDAFEWLIVHVIPAGSEVTEKVPTSKWPGRGSTSVLEKVKADFNGSSKTAVDRVVQLKLPKPDAEKIPPEITNQLQDLVGKLKSTILNSFDVRVSQYEADIREKDSQRNLPGWNFCTFFILKEGLALGFENVGLFEDALVGYDELSVGLDVALQDQLSGAGDQHGGTFLTYSEDLKSRAETTLSSKPADDKIASQDGGDESSGEEQEDDEQDTMSDPTTLKPNSFPLDSQQKPYRDIILANNISVFDFRVYIFSRQLLLLLKAARSSASHTPNAQIKEKEDLELLAEICERASEFITLASRTLRWDIGNGLEHVEQSYEDSMKEEAIDNLVSSWAYASVSQVLTQTTTNSLEIPTASLRSSKDLINASILTGFNAETRPGVPKRSSSLMPTSPPTPGLPNAENRLSASSSHVPLARPPLTSLNSNISTAPKAGAMELASARGDLYLLARRLLEGVGRKRGWDRRWQDLSLLFDENNEFSGPSFANISLDEKNEASQTPSAPESQASVLSLGIDTPALIAAIKSKKEFNSLYERLNDQIFRHYVAASRTRSAETAMADIAVLKYSIGDYSSAASYLHQLATFYGDGGWETLEGTMVELYGRCLKRLDRKAEYVNALLKLLGIYAALTQPPSFSLARNSVSRSDFVSKMSSGISHYVDDLFEASRSLSSTATVQIRDFFGNVKVDPRILHFADKDGFQVQFSLQFFLGQSIHVDSIKVRLVDSVDGSTNELWLERTDGVTVKSRTTKILLDSFATVHGKYFVDRIELRAGNIIFVQDYSSQTGLSDVFHEAPTKSPAPEDNRPFVICYPAAKALEVRISQASVIDLGGPRTVDIQIKSGWNEVSNGTLRVKPATAGLRLLVADVTVVDGSITIGEETTSGKIAFNSLAKDTSATLRMPYTMEGNQTTLGIYIEVDYDTAHGSFSYTNTTSLLSTLPVSVNVQDLFKDEQLFSRFTISPAMMIPLRVYNCDIASSQEYEVHSSTQQDEIFDVFPKQPASLVYKIKKRGDNDAPSEGQDSTVRSLRLSIDFTCLNEECLSVLEAQLSKDLEESPFSSLTRLLTTHLREAFSAQWTAHDLESIGLIREIEMFDYDRIRWKTSTKSLGGDTQKQLTEWLKEWHNTHQTLPLPHKQPSSSQTRRVVIPLDIPEIQVVHTAQFVLKNIPTTPPHIITIDDMIHAELTLHHTRRWCPAEKREPQSSLEFCYEIITNPDTWLLGGGRRGNFTSTEGESHSFNVMLLPQRSGHLLMPSVDVKSFIVSKPATDTADASNLATQRTPITTEVDYRNHAQTILVTPNQQKTTTDLDGFGTSGSGSTVDSDRRVAITG